ncbi:MAG: hypothetical protein ABR543_19480 [Gemmatimonadaceae bacterium]
MSFIRYFSLLSAVAIVAACGDGSPTESPLPTPAIALDDSLVLSTKSMAPGLLLDIRGPGRTATFPSEVFGRGVITHPQTGTDRTFFWDARANAAGIVTGTFEFFNAQTEERNKGPVVCFTIVGNTVYMAGLILQGSRVGFHTVWTATDNPDQFSGRFVALDPFHCATPFNFQLLPLKSGRIVITP